MQPVEFWYGSSRKQTQLVTSKLVKYDNQKDISEDFTLTIQHLYIN